MREECSDMLPMLDNLTNTCRLLPFFSDPNGCMPYPSGGKYH